MAAVRELQEPAGPQGTGSKELRRTSGQAVPHSQGTDLQGLNTAGRAMGWHQGPSTATASDELCSGPIHSVPSGAKGDGAGAGLETKLQS